MMKTFLQFRRFIVLTSFILSTNSASSFSEERITQTLTVVHGAVNGALLQRGDKILAFYGDPRDNPQPVDTVLFTHFRRDVAWAGKSLVNQGAKAIVPEREADFFTKVEPFWNQFLQARFHDYQQQTTKILTQSLPVAQTVHGGDTFEWEGIPIQVLDTPGYTRGSVTYLLKSEGKTIAFTGDLIYGDGKLLDLYSLQDAIPEAKIGGYHGYAARLADLLSSLKKVADQKPDLLVPARGPIIQNPQAAIARLSERVQTVYANYLSIDALRWYFKDEHILAKSKRVLGASATVDWMPMAEQRPLPAWIVSISNSRLILSADGSGFLVDCGGKDILEKLKTMRDAGTLASLKHIFVTHYHDDHTDQVPALVKEFGSKVYACRELVDIYENPSAYRLPCLTPNSISVTKIFAEKETWHWKEFEMTGYFFPGQTLYHQALWVKKDGGESVFFIGDSFTPSGIDDYCLLNRNLLHPGMGYFYCLDLLQQVPAETFLINQHVEPLFRYSREQIDRMRKTLEKRVELLRSLFPWDDPNFGIDEQWAGFYPYAQTARKGEPVKLRIKIMNHSPREQSFSVRPRLPDRWTFRFTSPNPARIPPRTEGFVEMQISPPANAADGAHLLTADIQWGDWDLREWVEGIITLGS